ncbi:TetR/AcrR family transcriptional regulator [Streptomyces sp. N2-109]|uniref:TetR/AcrR family transcriptional regulator n=1 Tax=Streptomyces gossypii TaxID=2883101 RepID=A0ABT2JPG2_9ACTN|nr:TetR/AcrR family transcriptional regulator [Streptomyces gossypii]MCT2589772.1 TetR/AcrR family transcriptional regulator [Streptomyces gossypii]
MTPSHPSAPPPPRSRRADARRSRASILEAALRLLNSQPDASVEAIATAAGVTRQTVYAHFPSREQLLTVALDQVTEETVAAMDASDLETGPAADALLRLLDAGSRTARRYPGLLQMTASLPVSAQADHARHAPVADRLRRVIERGQQAGEFDGRFSPDWLVAVTVKLGHAAAEEADAGRMSDEQAAEALHTTLLRALAAPARTAPAEATPPRVPG